MKIVGITGYARSGKDSLAAALKDTLRPLLVHRVSFGDMLKEEMAEATRVPVADQEKNRDLWRLGWQWWGTEFRRRLNGDDYWIKAMHRVLRRLEAMDLEMQPDLVVVTDVRFLNEAALIRQMGGTLIRVVRPPGLRDWFTLRHWRKMLQPDRHASEWEQRAISVDMLVVNAGSQLDLRIKAAFVGAALGFVFHPYGPETSVPPVDVAAVERLMGS